MFCIKCGEKGVEGSAFCPKCGAKLPEGNVAETGVTGQPAQESQSQAIQRQPVQMQQSQSTINAAQNFSNKDVGTVKTIGIILMVVGVIGFLLGGMMFGDIGIAAWIGSTAALISGFGFFKVSKALQNRGM